MFSYLSNFFYNLNNTNNIESINNIESTSINNIESTSINNIESTSINNIESTSTNNNLDIINNRLDSINNRLDSINNIIDSTNNSVDRIESINNILDSTNNSVDIKINNLDNKNNIYEYITVTSIKNSDGIIIEEYHENYVGTLYKNKKHGNGKLIIIKMLYNKPYITFIYEGQFISNFKHGKGIMTTINNDNKQKEIITGIWINDNLLESTKDII
jgi:hypothetical protein